MKAVVNPPLHEADERRWQWSKYIYTYMCIIYKSIYALHVDLDIITQENLYHLEIDMQMDKKV